MSTPDVIEWSLLGDLEDFLHDHRPHGTLTGDATEPAWNGYLLTVACTWSVTFGRWVTPEEADHELASWFAVEASRN